MVKIHYNGCKLACNLKSILFFSEKNEFSKIIKFSTKVKKMKLNVFEAGTKTLKQN